MGSVCINMVCYICVCIALRYVNLSLIKIAFQDSAPPTKLCLNRIMLGKSMNYKKKTKVNSFFIELGDVNKSLCDVQEKNKCKTCCNFKI